jgi:hypothetical protein
MTEELRLPIRGKDLVFPDGKAYCLVCGAPPSSARTVWFESPRADGGPPGSKGRALAIGVAAIAGRITFKAPLCGPYRWKAFRTGLLAAVFMLAAVGVIVLGSFWGADGVPPRKRLRQQVVGSVSVGLSLIPGAFGYVFWRRKDRGGIPADVRREGDTLVLEYPDRAPKGAP